VRLRHLAALPAAVVLAGLLSVPAAADPTTLYVTDRYDYSCDPSGPGTPADPFCTIQEAADAARPGQTVVIGPQNRFDRYPEDVHITTSGTPDAPITFTTGQPWNDPEAVDEIDGTLTFSGVHDVILQNLQVSRSGTTQPQPVTVTDSSRVTLDHDYITDGVTIGGTSSGVAVTRSETSKTITVGSGVTETTLSDDVSTAPDVAVAVHGATDTDIVNDTIADQRTDCGRPTVQASGGATGTVIENDYIGSCGTAVDGVVSVAGDSTARSIVDYDDVWSPAADAVLYSWAGAAYPTAAALYSATGQGGHDVNARIVAAGSLTPPEGSAIVDSGNADAPGVPATDLFGDPRADDPLVANTGVGVVDIGAVEREDPIATTVALSASQAPTGGTVTATVTASGGWGPITGYTVNFGDGSAPVESATPSVQHTYSAAGYHQVTATATDSYGYSGKAASATVTVVPPAPLAMTATLTPVAAKGVDVHVTETDGWNVTKVTYDFGDGTAPVPTTELTIAHGYATPGTYPVTVTVQDAAGNTATWSQPFATSGTDLVPFGPRRILDTRHGTGTGGTVAKVPAGGTLRLKVTGDGIPDGTAAVALNVTVTNPTAPGYVSVHPDGGARPTVSTLNFVAGQTVANATIVPVGTDGYVDLYSYGSAVDLVADVTGYFVRDAADEFTSPGPQRLLDTRADGTAVPAGGTVRLAVPAAGVTAVALNVTAVNPASAGYLTVYPDGGTRPVASSLNFAGGQTVANLVVVPVGADGRVAFYNGSSGRVDVVADLAGYFGTGRAAAYVPVPPARVFDTRQWAAIPARTTVEEVTEPAGPPIPFDVNATVVMNVTVTDTTSAGYLTVYGIWSNDPGTSNLNWTPGRTVPNMVFGPNGGSGQLNYHNGSPSPIDVLGDLLGYFD
jgi:PKD repeat protein